MLWKIISGLTLFTFLLSTPLANGHDYVTAPASVDTAPAPGVGQWTPLGGGYYQGSSGLWRAWVVYNCGCPTWKYEKVPCFGANTTPIQAPEGFDDHLLADYVKVIGWCRNERLLNDFKDATSGICGQPTNGLMSGSSFSSRSVTTGYGANGQTFQGIATAVTPAVVTDNLALAGHTQARMMERTMDLTQQVQAGINYSYLQAGELQKNQAVLSLAFAALQRTPETVTVTSGQTTGPGVTNLPGAGNDPRTAGNRISGIVDAGTKFLIEAGSQLNTQSCLACHSQQQFSGTGNNTVGPAKGLLLEPGAIAILDPQLVPDLHTKIAGHLNGSLKPSMPFKRPMLNAAQQTAYLAWFDSLAGTQYSAVANPTGAGNNGGYVEAPPAPTQN